MMRQKLFLLMLFCVSGWAAQNLTAQVTAADDAASVISEIPIPIKVLENDVYPCATPTLTITTPPANGTAIVDGDSIIYTSNAGYAGTDQFSYQVDCSGTTSVADVNLMVAEKPENIINSNCYGTPPANAFSLQPKYEVDGNGTHRVHILATPLVGDIDGDGIVEIMVPWGNYLSNWLTNGFLIFNGKTGAYIRQMQTVEFSLHGQAITMADVDGDGKAELFIQAEDKKIYCYDPTTGSLKSGFTTTAVLDFRQILQLVDINNDGNVELVAGRYIFNAATGALLMTINWPDYRAAYGSPHNWGAGSWAGDQAYNMFAMVDIDGDGDLEQAAGPYVFDIDLSGGTSSLITTANTAALGMNAGSIYGQTLALDFDDDGEIEIVVLGQPRFSTTNSSGQIEVYAYKPLTGEVISRHNWNGRVGLSIPYAGDLDGNGTPEVIFTDGNTYDGGSVVARGMIAVTYDTSSNGADRKNMRIMHQHLPFAETAGFTVFDFNQDGKTEIVYRGQAAGFFIVDGTTLANLSTPITNVHSGTIAEYPLVADVDGDGHADIITVSSNSSWSPPYPTGKLRVYESAVPGTWAPAKSVWNSWGYSPVSINEDMTVPKYQVNPATKTANGKSPYNLFLAQTTTLNQEGDLLFQTPEAAPGEIDYHYDPVTDILTVDVNVLNNGEATLGPPVYASLYNGSYTPGDLAASGSSSTPAAPGDSTTVTITVTSASSHLPIDSLMIRVNDDGTTYPVQGECEEGNNSKKREIILYQIAYDGNTSDGGTVPVDANYYNPNDPITILHAGTMSLTDAAFVGWTFTNPPPGVAMSALDVPADLVQPDSVFTQLVSDTTLYAVWGIDTTGPGGDSDSIPDYLQFKVTYQETQATSGTVPVDNNLYNAQDSAAVKGNEGLLALDSAVFIGWSHDSLIAVVTNAAGVPSDLMLPADSTHIIQDTTLYAVWAIDSTGPGGKSDSIPDYLQFEVTYDKTQASTGNEPIDGNLYNATDSAAVKGNEGSPQMELADATFIGWSYTDPGAVVITQALVPTDLMQPADSIFITQDTTLYAVWGEDKTGPGGTSDSIPDYLQQGVIYDKALAAVTGNVPVDGNLYNDGDSAAVKGNEGSPLLELIDGVFIGWSLTNPGAVITTPSGIPSDLMQPADSVAIPTGGGVTLYAVWSEDKTGPTGIPDSIPDYLQFEVIYDKTQASIGNEPVDGNLYNATDSAAVKGNEGSPQMELTDAVFIGWSYADPGAIITTPASIPADLMQPADSIFITQDTTLYAVWSEDRTGPGGTSDSIPDYLQFEIVYDDNFIVGTGGTGTVPGDINLYNAGDSALVLDNTGSLQLDSACFMGWSLSATPGLITTPSDLSGITLYNHPDSVGLITQDTTLYAVWMADSTGPNGIPDCIPDYEQFEVTYNLTQASLGVVPVDINLYNAMDSAALKGNEGVPQMELTDATFIGWSYADPGAVITTQASVPTDLMQPADSIFITSDTTLYAVWGEDKTGPGGIPDSIPDYLQFEVVYDKTITTAGGNVPVDGNLYSDPPAGGDIATVLDNIGGPPNLTLTDAVFIGWSTNKADSIHTSSPPFTFFNPRSVPTPTINVDQDTVLYAVWAIDKTGPGGVPDSIPDYDQEGVIYDKTIATSGNEPIDGNLYNPGDSAFVLGNVGVPPMALTNGMFIGWSHTGGISVPIKAKADLTTYQPLIQPGDSVLATAGRLYAIWAADSSGPGGVSDSVPDYLQFKVLYDGNTQTGGTVPVDINLYDSLNAVTIWGNVSPLTKTDACFIGWSANAVGVVTAVPGIPADLKQGGDVFPIVSDTTFYAVWAEDKYGPGGGSDSVPDYLQKKLVYLQNTNAGLIATGNLPSPDTSMHTTGTSAVIMGNTGGLTLSPVPGGLAGCAVLAGWSENMSVRFIVTGADAAAAGALTTIWYPGDTWVANAHTDLYAVWAYDGNCNGIPDYNEPYIEVTSTFRWPERQDSGDPSNPDYDRTKPNWYPEHDKPGETTLYAGCKLLFEMKIEAHPSDDRTFKLNCLGGALELEYLTDMDGDPLPDTYVLPAGDNIYRFNFLMKDLPEELEGQSVAFEAEFITHSRARDTSEWYVLYNHPSYDDIVVETRLYNGKIDFGITGGTPNLMMSINGRNWKSISESLTSMDKLSITDGASIWLREPAGCWEEQFFFRTYIDPTIRRYVELPLTDGVTTNPGPGKHYVEGHDNFIFTASYAGGDPLKVMAKGYYSNKEVELIGRDMEDGTYQYLLRQVVEPWDVTIGPDKASEITGENAIEGLSVWSHRNTLYIRTDREAIVYIYYMNGSLYKRLEVEEGETKEAMNRGVYVVVIDGKRYKVFIK